MFTSTINGCEKIKMVKTKTLLANLRIRCTYFFINNVDQRFKYEYLRQKSFSI